MTLTSKTAGVRKVDRMNEEMNTGELLVQVTEENQTRKILEILNECETLEEAKEKVKALLNK
ncbi:MAG: protein phosphatase [Lachnospiraceae bacterium]|nr:protein phosphatase [Lachnospiraceae bacterium]MCI9658726.1 protein phosphatase [Lachnospiraceae bacterium]